jgi:hypothetical protein
MENGFVGQASLLGIVGRFRKSWVKKKKTGEVNTGGTIQNAVATAASTDIATLFPNRSNI